MGGILKKISKKISLKMAIVLFVFAITPIFCLSFFYILQLNKIFKQEIVNARQEIIKGYASDVKALIDIPLAALESYTALLTTFSDSPERQHLALVQLSIDYPAFSDVFLLDDIGNRFVSSFPRNSKETVNLTENPGFLSAINGKKHVSDIFISKDYVPSVEIFLPLFKLNAIVGAVYAQVNLSKLWEVVDGIEIGKTGRAFVCNKNGNYIAHWDKKKILKGLNVKNEPFYADLIISESAGINVVDSPTNSKTIFTLIEKEYGLLFCIQQDSKEVFFFYFVILLYTWIGVVLVFIAALIISFFVGKKVVDPIKRLSVAVDEVSKRNYDFDLISASDDELGNLINSFAVMSKKLKKADANEQLAIFGAASAHIAHKVKNAIVSIKTYAQLLPQRRSNAEFLDKMQDNLIDNVEKVENMLSSFSRLKPDSKHGKIPVDVVKVINQLISIKSEVFHARGIAINFVYKNPEVFVLADLSELEEVFLNIINNAIDAMYGSGTLSISIKIEEKYLKIFFKDTGSGMDEDAVNKVFDFFYTTKSTGMGIGLAYCKRIIMQYDGDIQVRSKVGVGTVFQIDLPCRPNDTMMTINKSHEVTPCP